jgi:(S)-3,5-dihydroxyphenylglycine transaminase
MHHFYDAGTAVRALRLSCSTVTGAQIDAGIERVAALISDRLRAG